MAKLFKKTDQPTEAAVSSIPVPPADSALVIDLPEGQKLVLGKMEEGTVIEVATWRGTGRPDSRTNRLMLGVSFGGTTAPDTNKEQDITANLSTIERIQFKLRITTSKILSLLRNNFTKLVDELSNKKSSFNSKKKSRSLEQSAIDLPGRLDRVDAELNEDFDVEKWLDSVRSKSRLSDLASAEGGPEMGPKKSAIRARSRNRGGSKGPTKKKKK